MDLKSNMREYQTIESPGRIIWEHYKTISPEKTWFFQRGIFEPFTGGRVSCCWVPKRDDAGWNVKNVCQGATPWKPGIFLRGRVELFNGEWVSCCWVLKRDDAENNNNNYKTDKGNRKGKYKHFVWWNLMYKKVFSFFGKDLQKQL